MRSWMFALAMVATAVGGPQVGCAESVLRFIPQADLRVLDPIWTSANITRNHGYMVFDTLFGVDAAFQPQPEMVDSWDISPDKLVYTFSLRDKLRFHDGSPVRAADCVASLQRWMQRDTLGQYLAASSERVAALDEHRFEIRLNVLSRCCWRRLARFPAQYPSSYRSGWRAHRPTSRSPKWSAPARLFLRSKSFSLDTRSSTAETPIMWRAPNRRAVPPAAI